MNEQITDTSTPDRQRAIAGAGDNPPVTLKEARHWVYRGTTTRTFAMKFMGWMFSDTQDSAIQAEVRLFLTSLSSEEREELRKKATP